MRTIAFLIQKEFLQVFRNRLMVPIIFIIPVVQLIILPFAATFEMKNIRLYVVDNDHSQYARELIRAFTGSPFYKISGDGTSYKIAEDEIKAGYTDQVIQIPSGFEKQLMRDEPAKVMITNNAINAATATLMNAYTVSILLDFNKNIISEKRDVAATLEPVKVETSFWFNPDLDYTTFMVPGILVLLVTVIGMFLSAMNVVREKEIGTIDQINVTPVRKYHFIIGKLFPFWVIALFDLAFGLVIAKLIFNIPIVGSIGLLFAFAMVYLIAILSLGLFISTVTNTQQQAMFIAWFFLVIFILMSGLFTPIESMPQWAQYISKLNPVAYFIEVIRMVMLKGSGFADVKYNFAAMGGYSIIMLSFALWRYRKVA